MTPNQPIKFILGLDKLFLVTVIIPTLIATIYFGLIASDVYISESRFIVRSPQKQASTSMLSSLLLGSGFSRSQEDTYAVHDYLLSRDAMNSLNEQLQLVKLYSNPDIDLFSRFPNLGGDSSLEAFYKYYQHNIVDATYDSTSEITTLRVRARSAADAQHINQLLLIQGENLINKLNQRAKQDMIHFANDEVDNAEKRLKSASIALSNYRNQQNVFDPEKQSALQLTQVEKLQDELISAQTELAQVDSVAPKNPQIPMLRTRIKTLQAAIASETAKVAGSGVSLSNKAVNYERLMLDRELADKLVASALSSLETARNEAQRQQLYLERLVQPNLPDEAMEPRRWRNVLTTFILGMIVWGVLSIVFAGVREHHDR